MRNKNYKKIEQIRQQEELIHIQKKDKQDKMIRQQEELLYISFEEWYSLRYFFIPKNHDYNSISLFFQKQGFLDSKHKIEEFDKVLVQYGIVLKI